MHKPATAPTVVNDRAPSHDGLMLCHPFMDAGSVSTIANIASTRFVPPGRTAPGNATILDYATGATPTAVTLGSTEGGSLDLGSDKQLRIWHEVDAIDLVFDEFEFRIRLTSTANMGDTTARTLWQSRSTAADGRWQLQKTNVANTVVFRFRSGGTEFACTFTVTSLSTPTEFRVARTALDGNRAWMNGVEGSYGTGFRAGTQPLIIGASESMTLNKGSNPGLIAVLACDFYGTPLRSIYRNEFLADAYINLRPPPGNCPHSVWAASIRSGNAFEVPIYAKEDIGATVHFRGVWSTSIAGLDSAPTVVDTWSNDTPGEGTRFVFDNLPDGVDVYWRIEWSNNGSTWYPCAGGYQVMPAESTSPRFAFAFEDHYNDQGDTDNQHLPPKYSYDIGLQTGLAFEDSGAIGKQYGNYMNARAVWETATVYHGLISIGDGTEFVDQAVCEGHGTADFNPDMLRCRINAREQNFLRYKKCGEIEVAGNHACIASSYRRSGDTPDALYKQAMFMWRLTTTNPANPADIGTTSEAQLPLGTTPPAWAPGVTAVLGDIVRPPVDNYYGYRVDDITGSPVTTDEPTWSADPNDAFISGNVIYSLVEDRWDAACVSALNPGGEYANTESLRTWFRMDFGSDVSIFIADSETNSMVGLNGGEVDANTYSDYTFGATQTSEIIKFAHGPAKTKLFLSHRHVGGINLRTAQLGRYARGSGRRMLDGSYFVADGEPESTNEVTICALFRKCGVIWLSGHDHHHVIARAKNGMISVKAGTGGASSHMSFASSAPTRGWNNSGHLTEFGTPESMGALDQNGNDMRAAGIEMYLNVVGYDELLTSADGLIVRVIETALPTKSKNGAGYLARIRADVARFIAAQAVTVSGGRASLVDSLNPSPMPLRIGLVVPFGSIAAAVGSNVINEATAETMASANVLANRYDPRAETRNAIVWSAEADVVEGQLVFPSTHNGLMGIVTTAGTLGTSEPSWPTEVGALVSDGTAVYVALPVGRWPHPMIEHGLGTSIPVAAGTTGDVAVQWVPRCVYESDLLVAPRQAGGSTPVQARVLRRHRRLRGAA